MSRSQCTDWPGCPVCREPLTESMCGKTLECLYCGASYPRISPGEARNMIDWHEKYDVLPEDPDDRPYIWDIEED